MTIWGKLYAMLYHRTKCEWCKAPLAPEDRASGNCSENCNDLVDRLNTY